MIGSFALVIGFTKLRKHAYRQTSKSACTIVCGMPQHHKKDNDSSSKGQENAKKASQLIEKHLLHAGWMNVAKAAMPALANYLLVPAHWLCLPASTCMVHNDVHSLLHVTACQKYPAPINQAWMILCTQAAQGTLA